MTLGDWIPQAELRLAEAGINSPRLEARLLVAKILNSDWATVFAHPEWELNEEEAETLLERREKREPLAYILGWREFFGRRFVVNPSVLIPRQETEILVEQALKRVGPLDEPQILDLGSGSGCIAITLKLERPQASVLGSDISPDALTTARENAKRLAADVPFIQSDLFQKMDWRRFDMIVTNPPYIANREALMPEVGRHEPDLALFSGETGLEVYDQLAEKAGEFLHDRAWLLMEVGFTQAPEVKKRFRSNGWKDVETVQDLAGIDRVILARKRA